MKPRLALEKLESEIWQIRDTRRRWKSTGSIHFRVFKSDRGGYGFVALDPRTLSEEQWCKLISYDPRFENREDLPPRAKRLYNAMYVL